MRVTIRPTATKPYTESLADEPMSALATQADVNEVEKLIPTLIPQTVADSTAIDIAGIVADHNTLLAALRIAGVLV